MIRFRLFRFGVVGIIATSIHATVLGFLSLGVRSDLGIANLVAFMVSFLFSIRAQQSFTFKDRLAQQRLNTRAVLSLFSVNAIAALVLGRSLQGWMALVLPLIPAGLNYILLYFFSGKAYFRT